MERLDALLWCVLLARWRAAACQLAPLIPRGELALWPAFGAMARRAFRQAEFLWRDVGGRMASPIIAMSSATPWPWDHQSRELMDALHDFKGVRELSASTCAGSPISSTLPLDGVTAVVAFGVSTCLRGISRVSAALAHTH